MCKLRNRLFWFLDAVKGGTIRKAYQELKTFDAADSGSSVLAEHQKSALQMLLPHAINTTKFYEKIQSARLSEFPIVDKNIIRSQQKDFMSNMYDRSDLFTMTTSGSTGTPFLCYQNISKKNRVNAEVIYYSEKAGYSVGGNLIYLRAITKENYKSKLHQWIQNETLLDICNLDDQRIENILLKINEDSNSSSMLLAYGSTFEALKDYFHRKGISSVLKSTVSGVVSGAEMLSDATRDTISKVFNCRCFSRYSNQENGIIGQDDMENNVFIINETHYIVEIFKMDVNELAAEGEIGRIVITDLYNHAMPMIRYDTGDIGSIVYIERNGVNKKTITNFGGRRVDMVFDSYGNRLSPHKISNNFWSFPEIKQFQLIQESKIQYTLRLNVEGAFIRKNELKELLQRLLGDEAVLNIEMVEEIPVLASGKRKYIVNNMNKE